MTPRERFLSLLKHDILKLDLAELNFGIYRILNARRDLVLGFRALTLDVPTRGYWSALQRSPRLRRANPAYRAKVFVIVAF